MSVQVPSKATQKQANEQQTRKQSEETVWICCLRGVFVFMFWAITSGQKSVPPYLPSAGRNQMVVFNCVNFLFPWPMSLPWVLLNLCDFFFYLLYLWVRSGGQRLLLLPCFRKLRLDPDGQWETERQTRKLPATNENGSRAQHCASSLCFAGHGFWEPVFPKRKGAGVSFQQT